ncbi:hypothetical protein LTS17_004574 [Exophiala oligosperma]
MAHQNEVSTGVSSDPELERAINLSLLDQPRTRPQADGIFDKFSNPSPSLLMSLNNEFSPIVDPLGDTAIYIGVPEQEPGQSESQYQRIIKHFDVVHVVHSCLLLAMPETSRFTHNDLLGPSSIRSERRLRKLGVLDRLEAERGGRKFKYYIDLRPPTEDDAAVEAITKLNCTRGILTWHLLQKKYDLSELQVCGHDSIQEAAFSGATAEAATEPETEANDTSANQDHEGNDITQTDEPGPKIGESYTRLRHYAALERLLHAICDNDPKLDSAPKVWTFFAAAQCFGCAEHHRIAGWITTWIFNYNNANFIQNNPEVAYRIGMGIKSPDLVRDSFSILVGERALLYAADKLKQNPTPRNFVRSVHGREFEELDDDESSRISAAALALIERVTNDLGSLCRDFSWLEGSREYAKLNAIVAETVEEENALLEAKSFLEDYVRTVFICCLCLEYRKSPGLEKSMTQKAVYNSCSPSERMLTKTFWVLLSESDHFCHIVMGPEMLVSEKPEATRFKKAFDALGLDRPICPTANLTGSTLLDMIDAVNRFWLQRSDITTHKGKEVAHGSFEHGFSKGFPTAENSSLQNFTFESPKSESSNYAHPADHNGSPSKRRKTSNFYESIVPPSSPVDGDTFGDYASGTRTDWVQDKGRGQTGSSGGILRGILHGIPDIVFRPKRVSQDEVTSDANPLRQTQFTRTEFEPPQNSGQPTPATALRVVNPDQPDIFQFDLQDEPTGSRAAGGRPSSTTAVASVSRGWQHHWSTAARPGRLFPSRLSPGVCIDRGDLTPCAVALFDEATMSLDGSEVQNALRDRAHVSVKPRVMLTEIHEQINKLSHDRIRPAHLLHHGIELSTNLFDTLACLGPNEFRFLPIWCPDGNDDGTGGVFDDRPLMNADPAVSFPPGQISRRGHVGDDDDDSEDGSRSSFEDVASEAISTVGKASRHATDGSYTDTVQSLGDDVNDAGESADPNPNSLSGVSLTTRARTRAASAATTTTTFTAVEGLTRQVAALLDDDNDEYNNDGNISDMNDDDDDDDDGVQFGSDFDDDDDDDDDADTVTGGSETNDHDHEQEQEQDQNERSFEEAGSDFEIL